MSLAQLQVEVAAWLRAAQRTVVLTGAGISTDSGIRDFRGPQGVWTRDPAAEKRADIDALRQRSAAASRRMAGTRDPPGLVAQPSAGHLALARLEAAGRLDTLITQNIDGLHLDAGSSPERLIEIHGTAREYACLDCGARGPMSEALDRVRAGEPDPPCAVCGGILKSATVSFGQQLDPVLIGRAMRAARTADLFLAIGTSLTVYPVADLPVQALAAGARLVILNAQPTPLDVHAHAVLRGQIGELLPELVERATA